MDRGQHLWIGGLALLCLACSPTTGPTGARFVLGWEGPVTSGVLATARPVVGNPPSRVFAPSDATPGSGTSSADGSTVNPAPSRTSGGGSSGGGGAPPPPPPPNTAAVATTGLFGLAWWAGAATGGPAATEARQAHAFTEVAGLATSPAGDVVVCDRARNQVVLLPAAGAPRVLCGAADGAAGFWGDDLPAIASALSAPTGLVRDMENGVLYVADAGNRRIRHFAPEGRIYTLAGGGVDPAEAVDPATDALLGEVHGLAVDAQRNFYFTEADTGRIRRVDATGRLTTLAVVPALPAGALAAAVAGNRLWVAYGDAVGVLDPTAPAPTLAPVVSSPGKRIAGLAFDQLDTLYVLEADAAANGGTLVRAVPLGADGRAAPDRQPTTVAGTGQSEAAPLPATALPDARTQALAGRGACALYIDLHHAASPTVLSGQLYVGSSFRAADGSDRWGQVARLEPLP